MVLPSELSDTVLGRFRPERFRARQVIVLTSATHAHLHVADTALSARRTVGPPDCRPAALSARREVRAQSTRLTAARTSPSTGVPFAVTMPDGARRSSTAPGSLDGNAR